MKYHTLKLYLIQLTSRSHCLLAYLTPTQSTEIMTGHTHKTQKLYYTKSVLSYVANGIWGRAWKQPGCVGSHHKSAFSAKNMLALKRFETLICYEGLGAGAATS